MNSHLTILINDKPMALPDDFSIDIEDKNPVFNDTEMFSYPFSIPLEGNRWLFRKHAARLRRHRGQPQRRDHRIHHAQPHAAPSIPFTPAA